MPNRVQFGFALRLAAREGRSGIRRVGLYMASITLGVAALVSIHSFRADVARSVQEEADVLMGANARLAGRRAFPDSITEILDSLEASGVEISHVTTATSMVLAPAGGNVRLLQVRAVEGGFPFYGEVRTEPGSLWGRQLTDGEVLVDAAVLTQLGVAVGDSLVVGLERLRIAATVHDAPTDLGFETAIGPRVYISQRALERSQLLGFGSIARYEVFLRLPDEGARRLLRERYDSIFDATQIRFTLAEEQAQNLSNGVRFLGRFLALVGLGALLLGGIGVASAIHVYVREKRTGVAVLRCLGAGQWTAFLAYLIQAAGLGLLGATGGVILGIGVQRILPTLLTGVLPVDVSTQFDPLSAAAGLGIGVWVAVIFALIPLLQVRNVPPLQALRQAFEPVRRRIDPASIAAYTLLAGSVLALCVIEAPEPGVGLGFALALAVAVAVLAGTGALLMRMTRRFFPSRAPYTIRQGVSNLFRPQNQTISVTLALGFGAFVIGTIIEVEGNVRRDLTLSFGEGRPNLLFFDIQTDQLEGVLELLPEDARGSASISPLIPSRIVRINGMSHEELRAPERGEDRPEGWALRREYRNTYRQEVGGAERLVAGRWWDGTSGTGDRTEIDAGDLVGLSLEVDVAESLHASLGDTITWDIGGMELSSVVTSLREVDWNRLEPNFFAIFDPSGISAAPQTIIMVARVPDGEARSGVLRAMVTAFPNVSALDFSRVQEAIDAVLSKVRQAVTFLGAFTALAGIVVLIGALATSRAQRLREGALLKTLGARRNQVLTVLFTEYLALGTLATATGLLLSVAGAALVVPNVFDMTYVPRFGSLALVWLAIAGLTVVVGLAGSRGLLMRPPLAVLRDAPE